jgi:hypothetical protein
VGQRNKGEFLISRVLQVFQAHSFHQLTNFNVLIQKRSEDSIGWYRVVGKLTEDVLGGVTLVP